MSEKDITIINESLSNKRWEEYDSQYIKEGFPAEELAEIALKNPARAYAPAGYCDYSVINDGDTLTYGGYELTCVDASGHTPGQLCLYIKSEKLMFLGDHVLFDITPNITMWPGVRDSLRTYLRNLDKFLSFDVEIPLPAHRTASCPMRQRIAEITEHHRRRLSEAAEIVRARPGLTAYEITGV
jgi:glyoxylase-like metal-dependent hydrolase (beta-lactamase superfamily II)